MLATYISHDIFKEHLMPDGHPECPERLAAIDNQLMSSGLDGLMQYLPAIPASDEEILRVHSAELLQRLTSATPQQGIINAAPDVYLSPKTVEAARYAAGANVLAVNRVMENKTRVVFCGVRPPGHHAEVKNAMGFCLFNNVAIGAQHALSHWGLERVAILDFDVHHGNGTQDIFFNDPRVLFCSSFQHPFYPATNIDDVPEHIVNVPLAAGCRSQAFREAINKWWWPALEKHRPQLIFISAGFDAYIDDDMSSLMLVEQDYFWISQKIREYMDSTPTLEENKRCKGIISTLEGGYDLASLGRCVVHHLKGLAKL